MNNLSYYKGFTVKSLVFRNKETPVQAQDRTYDVAVRIERDDDPNRQPMTFHMPGKYVFYSLGDARRAAEEFGRDVINGKVPGCSLESQPAAGNDAEV